MVSNFSAPLTSPFFASPCGPGWSCLARDGGKGQATSLFTPRGNRILPIHLRPPRGPWGLWVSRPVYFATRNKRCTGWKRPMSAHTLRFHENSFFCSFFFFSFFFKKKKIMGRGRGEKRTGERAPQNPSKPKPTLGSWNICTFSAVWKETKNCQVV